MEKREERLDGRAAHGSTCTGYPASGSETDRQRYKRDSSRKARETDTEIDVKEFCVLGAVVSSSSRREFEKRARSLLRQRHRQTRREKRTRRWRGKKAGERRQEESRCRKSSSSGGGTATGASTALDSPPHASVCVSRRVLCSRRRHRPTAECALRETRQAPAKERLSERQQE